MGSDYRPVQQELRANPRVWLVTGVAGFIGSNLLDSLLQLGQRVVGLDDFSTGHRHNLEDVRARAGDEAWDRFRLIEGSIADAKDCAEAVAGVDFVLHQAALCSVPQSIDNPAATNRVNVEGFLNILIAARDAGVKRVVYASSSSVYGDSPELPKVEDRIGNPLSPYAVTKRINELYAEVFARTYGLEPIGLRYFNVFGPRQDPCGAYAAVIPRWISLLLRGGGCTIYGDGETSRDFCYVQNVVQANLLAAFTTNIAAINQLYNVGLGERITLNSLYKTIWNVLSTSWLHLTKTCDPSPMYAPFRPGDIRHSQADITKAARLLGYVPTHSVAEGLQATLGWYVSNLAAR